jgi:hypothetical protein
MVEICAADRGRLRRRQTVRKALGKQRLGGNLKGLGREVHHLVLLQDRDDIVLRSHILEVEQLLHSRTRVQAVLLARARACVRGCHVHEPPVGQ